MDSQRQAEIGQRSPQRIIIVGNSVGLFVRPPAQTPDQGNYGRLLADTLGPGAQVFNLCRPSETVTSLLKGIYDRVFVHAPHVVVIHLGINECTPRLVPHWAYGALSGIKPHEGRLSSALRARLGRLINTTLAPRLIPALGLRPWLGPEEFGRRYELILSVLRKEFAPAIFCLGINPTTQRVESLLPGASANIRRYSQIIGELAGQAGAAFLDPTELPAGGRPEDLAPDGIHISADGHRQVCAWLLERLPHAPRVGQA